MKSLIVIILISIGSVALADDGYGKRYNISLISKHMSDRPPEEKTRLIMDDEGNVIGEETYTLDSWNEVNPGFGVEAPTSKGTGYLTYGAFINSYKGVTGYAGVGQDVASNQHITLFWEAVFIVSTTDGYPGAAGMVGARFKVFGHGFKVNYVPHQSLGSGNSDFFTLQYQLHF